MAPAAAAAAAGAAAAAWNCTAGEPSFADAAVGAVAYSAAGLPYVALLAGLALLMGLGKGGVPGASTSSVALNSLLAPAGQGCLDASVAMGVPITFLADVFVVFNYVSKARWEIIAKLLPATAAGVAVGSQVVGNIPDGQARLLIGTILLCILTVSLAETACKKKAQLPSEPQAASSLSSSSAPSSAPPSGGAGAADTATSSTAATAVAAVPPAFATSLWFAAVVGVVGGFATILTNSMGPILNVYLLTLKLEPAEFVGTRATFFTVVNTLKLAQRLAAGTLSLDLLQIGAGYGTLAVVGVFLSKQLVKRMSKRVFTMLEYSLMTYAAFRLIRAGLE